MSAPANLVFDGNTDFLLRKDNLFADGGVRARYMRVKPVHWHGPTAAMRVGLIMQGVYIDIWLTQAPGLCSTARNWDVLNNVLVSQRLSTSPSPSLSPC